MSTVTKVNFQIVNPTSSETKQFWDKLFADPIKYGSYMDTLPDTYQGFMTPIRRGEAKLWCLYIDGELGGGSWVHDIQRCHSGYSGWMASYYFPEQRGKLRQEALRLANQTAISEGVKHLFAGARISNRVAQKFAIGGGYHYLGDYADFGWFEGQLDGLAVFTLHPNDQAEAWLQAEKRANYHRDNPPKSLTLMRRAG